MRCEARCPVQGPCQFRCACWATNPKHSPAVMLALRSCPIGHKRQAWWGEVPNSVSSQAPATSRMTWRGRYRPTTSASGSCRRRMGGSGRCYPKFRR